MRIRLRLAKARIVLGASDHSGLLHGLEVGSGKGGYLLWRTAKGAVPLVGTVDHGHVKVRGKIGIDPKSKHIVSSLRALVSGHMDIPSLTDFCGTQAIRVNITQAVIVSALFIG